MDSLTRFPKTPVVNKGKIEKSNLFDEIGKSVLSPTGKTIMGLVNNFGNSPFRFQSPKKRSVQSTLDDPIIITSKKQKGKCATQNDQYSKVGQDWLEIPVIGDKLLCLDFSLRTKVLVECNLNFCLRSVMAQDNTRKHLAYWKYSHVLSPDFSPAPISREGNQRSAAHSIRSSSKTNNLSSTKQEMSDVPSAFGKRLINLVKGDRAIFSSEHLGHIQRGESTSTSMNLWRWQEALRSIFLNWCDSIKALVDGHEKRMIASDIYFYCLAKDHSAIFRVDEISDTNSKKKYEPRVILSRITSELKIKLEREGIDDIQNLRDRTSEVVKGFSPSENGASTPMSPNTKAELEALRLAQAFGENAGADVRVKSDVRKVKNPPAGHAEMPCSISGFDNVSCFFEVYLNSFGQMQTLRVQYQHLPVLVCDTIGPFLHASLENLKFRPLKTMGTESVRLEGLIMPGAFRSVVATITREVIKGGKSSRRHRNIFDDKEAVGAYMIIETATNDELNPVLRNLEDSRAFNRLNTSNNLAESNMLEREKGRCIKRLVWEVKSPEVLACNFE